MLSDKNRTVRLTVRLSAEELAQMDRLRAGLSRGAYIRSLLREGRPAPPMPSHTEAIAILAEQARDGSATAATALEKALRPVDSDPVQARIDELAAKRRARGA